MKNIYKIIIVLLIAVVIGAIIHRNNTTQTQIATQDQVVDSAQEPPKNYQDFFVSQSSDDAEEGVDGIVDISNEDLDLGQLSGFESAKSIGIRYDSVTISTEENIKDAFLEFTMEGNSKKNKDTELIIHAELSPNSQSFTEEPLNISSRELTQASVIWSPETWDPKKAMEIKPRTPNIYPLIQEVIQQEDWELGNPITFIITGTGERDTVSFDGGGEDEAPILRLELIN